METEFTNKPKRRTPSTAGRRRVVEETFEPRALVVSVARRHNVNPNQVLHRRCLYRDRQLEADSLLDSVQVTHRERDIFP